jgi:hypothetical protein
MVRIWSDLSLEQALETNGRTEEDTNKILE